MATPSGQNAPLLQFTLPTSDGKVTTTSSLRGHPTVISTFSTWLPSATQQLSALAEAAAAIPDARVIGLDELESVSRAQALLAISNLDFPVTVDEQGKLAGAFGPTGVPANVFVDRHGVVKKIIFGVLTKDELTTGLRGL